MLSPFCSEMLEKSDSNENFDSNHFMLLCHIIQYSYNLRAEEFVYLHLERDSNQILSTILNGIKKIEKKKKTGRHCEVHVKHIRLRPFLTKCSKLKVNYLLAGNIK